MPGERAALLALAGWEPTFAADALSVGRWVDTWRDADGVYHMPWFEYDDPVERFREAVVAAGWVVPFDWMIWAGTPEGRHLIDDPAAVATASADDLRKLLTTIIRGERFSEGSIAAAIESGHVLAICRRAGELARDGG